MLDLYTHTTKKIGITERADPVLNFSWIHNMKKIDCTSIISKKNNA